MDNKACKLLATFFTNYKLRTYRKKDIILHEGDTPSGVYYIKEGYVRSYAISQAGEEITRIILGPGSLFPIRWAFSGGIIDFFAEPMTDVLASHAPREAFLTYMKENQDVLISVTEELTRRMGGTYKRLEYLRFGDAYKKVAAVLVVLAIQFGEKHEQGVRIQVPLTHTDIASLIGAVRETVSIEIEKLRQKELIMCKERIFIIPDMQKLATESHIDNLY